MTIQGVPTIALIPARGGSKRLPGKNLRKIGNQPLLIITIQAAKGSAFIDTVVVTSDDDQILQLAKQENAVSLARPVDLATDTATATDVVKHFISTLTPADYSDNPYIIYLQPTSPLRTAAHIDESIELMVQRGATTLVSVTPFQKSPFKGFTIDETGRLKSLFDEKLSNTCQQDLPDAYITNGAVYIFRVSDFIERDGFPSNGSVPYVMKPEFSIDIDTEEDFEQAEKLMKAQNG